MWAANHSLLVGVLPVASFASGHTFFVQRLFEFQKIKPYVVHTTFQVRCVLSRLPAAPASRACLSMPLALASRGLLSCHPK